MQVQWFGYHEVMGTPKPYQMLKNLFEFIALKGDGDGKTLGARTGACTHEPLGETSTI